MVLMKQRNYILRLIFVLIGTCVYSQTITLNACHPLIENQDYVFIQKTVDNTGRNTFETTPVDEDSPCGGIGNCEFQIAWNESGTRWEIYADDGNGTFANTYVLYYNTEPSLPNPPSLSLGNWTEETSVTQSLCGAIISLTGDMQDTTLGVRNLLMENQISIYPNPSNTIITIGNFEKWQIQEIDFFDISGRLVMKHMELKSQIDVSKLSKGVYFIKLTTNDQIFLKKLVVQ